MIEAGFAKVKVTEDIPQELQLVCRQTVRPDNIHAKSMLVKDLEKATQSAPFFQALQLVAFLQQQSIWIFIVSLGKDDT